MATLRKAPQLAVKRSRSCCTHMLIPAWLPRQGASDQTWSVSIFNKGVKAARKGSMKHWREPSKAMGILLPHCL